MNNTPFNLSEIDDVRILITVKDKHYSIIENKERCKEFGVNAQEIRKVLLITALRVHDIVTPALEDIYTEKLNITKE